MAYSPLAPAPLPFPVAKGELPATLVDTKELICSPSTGEPIKSQPEPFANEFTYLLYVISPVLFVAVATDV